MLSIDTENMIISITRGDTANIVFSAVDENGNTYTPQNGDILRFAVAKKAGGDRLIEKENVMSGNATDFWTVTISGDDWLPNGSKMKFGDYVFDVQLTQYANGFVDTIIGVTDTITPTFRVWGDVAKE